MTSALASPMPLLSAEQAGEFRESNAMLGDAAKLRGEMARSGYLFLRGLIPAGALAAFDDDARRILVQAAWASSAEDGQLTPRRKGAVEATTLAGSRAVQRRLLCCESLHRLGHNAMLFSLLTALLGESGVLRHPRPVARVVFPVSMNEALPTPPHQDHRGMQGPLETYTAWIAMDACSRTEGGLAIAEGSHLAGLRPYAPTKGALVLCCESDTLAGSWRTTDFSPGDVVIFHSLAVHAALPNHSISLRRSVDCRYQRANAPVCATTVAEAGDLAWEEMYFGWEDEQLQRYWERLSLDVVPFDAAYARS